MARSGAIAHQSQSSLAVSADGKDWVILNASPDIRTQLSASAPLWPAALRHSPLKAVLLTNGDIDHIGGLLTLREKQPFTIHLSQALMDIVSANPVFSALDPEHVMFEVCEMDAWFDAAPSMRAKFFAVPGKVPLYLESAEPDTQLLGGQTVGAAVEANGARLLYIPSCAKITKEIMLLAENSDAVFFDGTLFRDDEMICAGLGSKTGFRMGHMPITGEGGSLEVISKLPARRKVYVHMNNTNPVWLPDSAERRTVESSGVEIGYDGMEVLL